VVAAVYYFASLNDQSDLLDYLGEPDQVVLHPWPVVDSQPVVLARGDALAAAQVMIARHDFGPPTVIRPGDAAMNEPTKSGVFNQLNWGRLRPGARQGLGDSNASPVLFWTPGAATGSEIGVSTIGSQADAMSAISNDYERWVNRVVGWIRRKGTTVWGMQRGDVRPDLDIQLDFINTVYALPGALAAFENGVRGRGKSR
jgi:hypothetical protein